MEKKGSWTASINYFFPSLQISFLDSWIVCLATYLRTVSLVLQQYNDTWSAIHRNVYVVSQEGHNISYLPFCLLNLVFWGLLLLNIWLHLHLNIHFQSSPFLCWAWVDGFSQGRITDLCFIRWLLPKLVFSTWGYQFRSGNDFGPVGPASICTDLTGFQCCFVF